MFSFWEEDNQKIKREIRTLTTMQFMRTYSSWRTGIFIFYCLGHYDKSDLPHCWYTWLMFSLIPIMFIAGVVVQLRKTGQGRDHRQGKLNWWEWGDGWVERVVLAEQWQKRTRFCPADELFLTLLVHFFHPRWTIFFLFVLTQPIREDHVFLSWELAWMNFQTR